MASDSSQPRDRHRPARLRSLLVTTRARGTRHRSCRTPAVRMITPDASMQPAFLVSRAFPPPAPRSNVLTRRIRACTAHNRCWGNRGRAAGCRNFAIANVSPTLVSLHRPADELVHRVAPVDLLDFDRAARHRLRAPLARDPAPLPASARASGSRSCGWRSSLSQLDAMVASIDTFVRT